MASILRTGSLALLIFAAAAAGRAEAGPPPGSGSGELARAGQALNESRLFPQADRESAPLEMKRRALLDRPVVEALALLRRGLSGHRPAPTASEAGGPEARPDRDELRRLERLLALQQYVFLADGRIPEAVGNARLGLALGSAVPDAPLASEPPAASLGTLPLLSFGRHLEQLSLRDCVELRAVCLEWLRQPSPLLALLEAERRRARQALAIQREAILGEKKDPERAETPRLFAQAEKLLELFFARQAEELRKPAWQRSPVELPTAEPTAAALVSSLLPKSLEAVDARTREQTLVRLLACHCAILRRRWEMERLPGTLAELELGELALDPYTGRPFHYEVFRSRYTLTSAGPPAHPGEPGTVNGRRPISLVPE